VQGVLVRLHKDWIVDLYYKEMVNTMRDKDHDKYKESTQKSKTSEKRDRTISVELQSQK